MNQLKYIIVNSGWGDEVYIFSNTIEHFRMMQRVGASKDQVVSAGFLQTTTAGARCYGNSHSLGIGSRGDVDSKLINEQAGDNFD